MIIRKKTIYIVVFCLTTLFFCIKIRGLLEILYGMITYGIIQALIALGWVILYCLFFLSTITKKELNDNKIIVYYDFIFYKTIVREISFDQIDSISYNGFRSRLIKIRSNNIKSSFWCIEKWINDIYLTFSDFDIEFNEICTYLNKMISDYKKERSFKVYIEKIEQKNTFSVFLFIYNVIVLCLTSALFFLMYRDLIITYFG